MNLIDTLRHNAPISREHYMHRAADRIEKLEKQRDELLAALIELVALPDGPVDMSRALAAIASVKESK